MNSTSGGPGTPAGKSPGEHLVWAEARSRGKAHPTASPSRRKGLGASPVSLALVPTARMGAITAKSLIRMQTANAGEPVGCSAYVVDVVFLPCS